MIIKKVSFQIASFIALIIFLPQPLAAQSPNVILIVTDDQGYGDLSCHGNPVIKTPNIDKLSSESVRFTDFHVDPTCAPSRAALMTGKYSHRVGVWHTVCGGNHLRASEKTMANLFKENGYRTGAFGKWHLGANFPYRPMDRGFDEWVGQGDGGTGTTDDWFYNDRVNDYYWHNGERVQKEGFAPDVFFDAAINFIKQDEQLDNPFFVYLATYLPHHPHTLPDSALAEKYNSEVSDDVAYFFAGIDRIDKNIGRLRKALEESGKAENTIFIFMSDNGGKAGVKLYNAGMRGHKAQVYEGGHRVPFFIHWLGGNLKHGMDNRDLTSHIDLLPTLIDLCGLSLKQEIDFDGRSFKQQLFTPELQLSERILFVENQRTFVPEPWVKTAGMTNRWRLIDNSELYDISNDLAQTKNVFDEQPGVVKMIQEAHKEYWARVKVGDRNIPRPVIGHHTDPETFLTSSDWYLPNVPWNHAQVAKGKPLIGSWHISVPKDDTYLFEVRRWPRETNTPIQDIPTFTKTIDSWSFKGGVTKLIYGKELKALPVQSIKLEVGGFTKTKQVKKHDSHLVFEVDLKKGDTVVKGTMFNNEGEIISGTYYMYITRKN